jgi:hypothetical protein
MLRISLALAHRTPGPIRSGPGCSLEPVASPSLSPASHGRGAMNTSTAARTDDLFSSP